MKHDLFSFTTSRAQLLAILLLLTAGVAVAAEDECGAVGEYGFVCGPISAEDLVLVPATRWIITSGMAAGASMVLIDSVLKSWEKLYPADRPRAVQNMDSYGACPGSPDPNNLVSHGLHIRAGTGDHSTLYVVGHGEREAIEVFDVDASGAKPVLTWVGCVMSPGQMAFNSVTSLRDGSLLATIPLHTGRDISEGLTGVISGAAYRWSPGDDGFEKILGTELPYGNGIEISADETEFYIASTGSHEVIAYSHSNPARRLRSTGQLKFAPDNLHMDNAGRLVTAGLVLDDPVCGNMIGADEFDLDVFATCPRPFIVAAFEPRTMHGTELATSAAIPQFSNVTMGLQVGDDIWVGTFAGDRVAYRSLGPAK